MIANLTLLNSNINARERGLDGQISNGSDEYELVFKIKSDKIDIEVLKVSIYTKNLIYINMDYGFYDSKVIFCERVKNFMTGLMDGTNSELNLLDNEHFYGFKYENYILTKIYMDENELKAECEINMKDNGEFYDSITKIINQLNNI
jgi:hypothetical protein